MFVYVSVCFVLCLCKDWFCGLTWRKLYIYMRYFEVCVCLWPNLIILRWPCVVGRTLKSSCSLIYSALILQLWVLSLLFYHVSSFLAGYWWISWCWTCPTWWRLCWSHSPFVYMVVPVKNGQVCPKLVEFLYKIVILQHAVIETLDQICVHALNKVSWWFVNCRSLQNLT